MSFDIGEIIRNMSKKAVKGLSQKNGLGMFAPMAGGGNAASNAGSSMTSIGSGKKINYGYQPYHTNNLNQATGQIGPRGGVPAPRWTGSIDGKGQILAPGAIRGWGGGDTNWAGTYDPGVQAHRNSPTNGSASGNYDPLTQRSRNGSANSGLGNAISTAAGSALGGIFKTNKDYVDPDPQHNSFGGRYGTMEGAPGGPPIGPVDNGIGGMDSFPTAPPEVPTFTPPEIKMKDFTDQAKKMAAGAYQPFYDAILKGKANAAQQTNTSDQIVKGLYASLVNDTQKSGQAQAAQYDQSSQQAAAQAAALQSRQGQIYDDSAQSQAALLRSLGQEASAGQLLSGNSSDKAFQQSEAAAGGQAQQDYYAQQKQGAQDATTGTANAQRTSGTVARENLIKDLGNVLSQYDMQSANAKTQEGTTALDLATQLSNTDLSNQQNNAQNQMTAFGMNQDVSQAALKNQQGAWDRQYQMNQDQQNNSLAQQQLGYQQSQDAADRAYRQSQDQQDQANKDRQYGLDENQFKIDAAAQQAKMNGAGASPTAGGFIPQGDQGFGAQSGPQQVVATVDSMDPGRGQEYIGLFNKIVSSINLDQFNGQSFARKASEDAQANGLSPAAAYAAATTFWNKVMNRS